MSEQAVIDGRADWALHEGDCLPWLRSLPDGCVDAVVTDPPYPEISRAYGRMKEPEWQEMMRLLVVECRRVLKPSGSAMFVLQSNFERQGKLRLWLYEFALWCGREWNIVQDAYWWNIAPMPTSASNQFKLMRPSLKWCVWVGEPGCFRDQEAVLWEPSERAKNINRGNRALRCCPSGHSVRESKLAEAIDRRGRGGVTPMNVLPIGNGDSVDSAGTHGHGAGTPRALTEWWVKYISPAGGVVLDPFAGSGTTGIAALRLGRRFLGAEMMPEYAQMARGRLAKAEGERPGQRALNWAEVAPKASAA